MRHSRTVIVRQAQARVGIKEESAAHHEIVDRYNAHKPLAFGYMTKYEDPWCATFISYLAIITGYTDIIPTECSCRRMIGLAGKMGIWHEDDSYVPRPGDIILYDWKDSGSGDDTGIPDHMGMVEKVTGGVITVIEGNHQDAVGRREIAVNGQYIRGYILPRYDEE